MNAGSPLAGLFRHFLLTLRLNFQSPQALAYGYFMPVFFLLAFGSVFRSDTPPLLAQMGQVLTICILGGASLGLPTALVAERERGIWRHYRLLPIATTTLLLGTLLARLLIIAGAVILQVSLARLIFGTPWPLHPVQTAVAFLFVAGAFMGLGLLVAALANDVPAVQALGQCLFLPMILIGGVGVPLVALPVWAQRLAGFMPGRYAVDVLQQAFSAPEGLTGSGFSLLALTVIGLAAGLIGLKLFRWEAGRRIARPAVLWVGAAFAAWILVGLAAAISGRLAASFPVNTAYTEITDTQIEAITYDDLPGDNELVTRLAPPSKQPQDDAYILELTAKIQGWPPAQSADLVQQTRALLAIAAIADISADLHEAKIGRLIFDELQVRHSRPKLRAILAWIILNPGDGTVITQAAELGLRRRPPEKIIRERSVLYAKKYLGRLTGKIRN